MKKTTKTRLKTAANTAPVPENIDEAADFVALIGDETRSLERIQIDMKEEMAAVKKKYEELAAPHIEERAALTEGLRIWASANRKQLTRGGKVKYVRLPTGKIKWRTRPPSVTIRGAEAVLKRLKEAGLTAFIRVKETINRAAISDNPEAVAHIPGIKVGSAGEDFVIEPFFEGELSGQEDA